MADATSALPSVGVWDQLHCFLFFLGFPSSLRPGSGLAPTVKGPSPSSPPPLPLPSKEETVKLLPHANGGVGGFGSLAGFWVGCFVLCLKCTVSLCVVSFAVLVLIIACGVNQCDLGLTSRRRSGNPAVIASLRSLVGILKVLVVSFLRVR